MVKKYCEMFDCTQAQLAEKIGLSLAAIGKWKERGEIPKSAQTALNLLAENERLKRELAEIKSALRVLSRLA